MTATKQKETVGWYRGFGVYEAEDGTLYAEFTNEQRGRVRVGEGSTAQGSIRYAINHWYAENR